MKIRLGYVSIAKTIDVTCSKTITYTNYSKLDNNDKVIKLNDIIISNFNNLEKIIKYNIKNNIHFYRLTSKLIPLATHSDVYFDYINKYTNYYKKIGDLVNTNNIRVDTHPDQFCVLNSSNPQIVKSSISILEYHKNMLKAFNFNNPRIILHVGSSALGKKNSITRFINNFNKLNNEIKKMIIIENDDKVYNIIDVLELCNKIKVPMVLDYHHFMCNNNGECIKDYIKDIFDTWNGNIPKIHFSSPKNNTKKDFRSHHDFINSDDFIKFIEEIKFLNYDFDVMIEAKEKDFALFKLVRELKYKTNYKFIDDTTFEI